MPSRYATTAETFGIGASALQVATMTRSMSAGDRPLPASALPPATNAMSGTLSSGPANRRLTMPTRLRIHSSLVSTRAARSSLVTTLPGWYPPNDRTRAPGAGGYGVAENGGTADVMRPPFLPGGPIPPDPPQVERGQVADPR